MAVPQHDRGVPDEVVLHDGSLFDGFAYCFARIGHQV